MVVLLIMGLLFVYGLFDFSLYHKYFFKSSAIFSNYPRFNNNWFPSFVY
jgi:hypothetical protein